MSEPDKGGGGSDAVGREVSAAMDALRASEASYRGLFNTIRQAIYIQDPEGRFVDVNDGAVAMYVKGDFQAVGKTGLKLTPGSTLDLYVDGDVTLVGDSSFGEGASPGSVRVYVAGERELSFVGGQRVVGSLYAPLSDLELVGASAFDGSLFVRNVEGVGSLEVRAGGQMVATPDSELCRAQPVLKGIE